MQILYGAMPDKELITISQAEYIKEMREKRDKMAKQAKSLYEMSKIPKTSQTNHILQGLNEAIMA